MIKRVFLFVVVNIFVLITLQVVMGFVFKLLGIEPGGYLQYLTIYAVVFGFGGAFISLLISKWMAKSMMGVQVIDQNVNDPTLRFVVERVHHHARMAKLPAMPEVGVYDSPVVNAFATGPSKGNSLVAVSTGLLRRMRQDEVDGVLAHEVSHIANGDMVTMTLLQGVINAVVLILARLIANVIVNSRNSENERGGGLMYFGIVMGLEIALSLLGAIVVNYFSRAREYRADAGGAKLAGRDRMIAALRALQGQTYHDEPEQQTLATLKISGKPKTTLMALFSTHPPLEERIQRLEMGLR